MTTHTLIAGLLVSSALGPEKVIVAEHERLNLGCGRKKIADAVNVDVTSETDPDLVHDLNQMPWPLPCNRFAEVLAFDVIEHLNDILGVMEEIHRVCKPGAIVRITVPHFSSHNAFTDPTHRHYFGCSSFDYFTGEHEHSYYTRLRFRKRACALNFHPSLFNKLVHRLARRWPASYEQRWAWIFPAWFLYVELEVVKNAAADALSSP